MFDWFAPSCPLGTWEKTWTETRMRWLAQKVGIDRLLDAEVIEPTDEYFPELHTGTPDEARQVMEQLADCMDIDVSQLELEIVADVQMPGAAGHYDAGKRKTIRLASSLLPKLPNLVATLAHELAHELLLGSGLLSADVPDHEWVTDLLPAYLGLGIFAANSALHEKYWTSGQMSWWTMSKHGYLPARIFGYAFALFAFMRGEAKPPWAKYLRLDASSALAAGLNYLDKTDDTVFHPNTIDRCNEIASVKDLIQQLEKGSPSFRLAALWDIGTRGTSAAEAVPAVARCLGDRDPDIPGEAARTLAALGPSAEAAVPLLRQALWHNTASVRVGAVQALGALNADPDAVIPEVAALLNDGSGKVVAAAAQVLRLYGPRAAPAAEKLLDALTPALVECDHALIDDLIGTLRAVVPDAERRVQAHLRNDPDLCKLAQVVLDEQQK